MHPVIALCFIILFMSGVWGWYLWTKNPSVVDVAWPLGLMTLGLLDLTHANFSVRTVLFSLILCIWGIRLAGFLWWTRIRLHQHDKRYTELKATWCQSADLAFLLNYQLQGLFILIISLPWYFIAYGQQFSWFEGLAFCFALAAIAAESLADRKASCRERVSSPV